MIHSGDCHQLLDHLLRGIRVVDARQQVAHVVDDHDVGLVGGDALGEHLQTLLKAAAAHVKHEEVLLGEVSLHHPGDTVGEDPFRGGGALLRVIPHRLQRRLLDALQLQHAALGTASHDHRGEDGLTALLHTRDGTEVAPGEARSPVHPHQELLFLHLGVGGDSELVEML